MVVNMNTPAFPTKINTEHFSRPSTIYSTGMTLRDYFAAKAMQGMMADGQAFRLVAESTLANTAYEIADAMLKARQE
jgi:hypothetical protein